MVHTFNFVVKFHYGHSISLTVHWDTAFQCKYLWNSSTVECLKCANLSFKKQWGWVRNNDLPQLVTSIDAKWRGGKKCGVFLPVCIQSKCSMSKGGFITSPKKNILPMMKTWLGDLGSTAQLLLHCHSNYPWSPVASDLGGKDPGQREWAQISTKDTFWGDWDAAWESWALCPSLGCVLNGYKGPQRKTLWDFDVAKTERHVALPSIRKKTRKSPTAEKYQQNGCIKATFMDPQRRNGMV